MPANLTPQYVAAEERFRQAASLEEKIEALREMMAVVPKHKGTEKLQADLKRKLSKLQEEQQQGHRAGGRRLDPGHVPREGAGQIALIGPPNSGKSSLLAALTHARPEIAEYPFTTRQPLPGMMTFEDIQVQLVDTPPFVAEPFDPVLVNVARGADACLVVLDPSQPNVLAHAAMIPRFLVRCRIVPPGRPVPEEFGISARLLPVLLALNKCDRHPDAVDPAGAAESLADRTSAAKPLADRSGAGEATTAGPLREAAGCDLPLAVISARRGDGLEDLRARLFGMLSVVRVYAKEPGKKPDMDRPFVLKRGETVLDLARVIHKDLAVHFRFARIWGSARFEGQPVERDHPLEDRDVVEIHA